jgi:DNA-binding NarL/FixJ family response regulator
MRNAEPVLVGLVVDEPIRMEGLASVFDALPGEGCCPFKPVFGSMDELLSVGTLGYLVVDLHSVTNGLGTLEAIRRARHDLRLIVIGPESNDEMVINSIMAGARAYLDLTAGPETVRKALQEVTNGSIWAPRRLLSRLIDRLLKAPHGSHDGAHPHLTDRERQVLDLILLARSNREIARQLGIEERTVKAHVGRLMRKTGADNRIELSMRAVNGSLIPEIGVVERRRGDRRKAGAPSGPGY